ncbi:MAG: hypothetical protein PVI23_09680 [Maricaulaceae bacterium]|jgi:hypothetical protein
MSSDKQQEETEALMAKYGVTRTMAYQYHFKTYRYSNLEDAIAQAKRAAAAT